MINYLLLAQIIVATSVGYVWIFRYNVIIKEFKEFGLSDLTRTFVGASKISLATLLIAGIWYPSLIPIPSILMGLFMLAAQYFHFKIKNPFIKHLPSLFFLILCVFITLVSFNII
jgi:DoxX-like family